MLVLGENNNAAISGAFLVRGQDHVVAFDVAPDWESYDFKKLDGTNEADKEFIRDAWTWDKPIDGKPVADGKVFK
jgi:elongation factor 1-gamma